MLAFVFYGDFLCLCWRGEGMQTGGVSFLPITRTFSLLIMEKEGNEFR